MVTYSDLIQIGIFIVALANLIYQIFRDRKKNSRQLLPIADGLLISAQQKVKNQAEGSSRSYGFSLFYV